MKPQVKLDVNKLDAYLAEKIIEKSKTLDDIRNAPGFIAREVLIYLSSDIDFIK